MRASGESRVFVLSGPAGVGKTSLLSRLRERRPAAHFCITATTRPPRDGERDGVDYFFLSEPEFLALRARGGLLEWAYVPPGGTKLYGTPSDPVREALARGQDVVLSVDVQGARSVRVSLPGAVLIFLAPPDFDTLQHRLVRRGSETASDQTERLENARQEMAAAGEFDFQVVNQDGELERAVAAVEAIMSGQES